MSDPEDEETELEQEVAAAEVALRPSDVADFSALVDACVPADIREKYEVHSYRNAAVILSKSRRAEFLEIMDVLRGFSLTTTVIRTAGGNKSEVAKWFGEQLVPLGWHETIVEGDLLVRKMWREGTGRKRTLKSEGYTREKFLAGHKIDFVKGRVALDLEWNSKDQTFDRDLYAFAAFAQCGVVDAGVLITRGKSLNDVIRGVGPALKKDGSVEMKPSGEPRPTKDKYGASTTWMGKLLYRLNAGRNGGCPVLVVGITPKCVSDWSGGHET